MQADTQNYYAMYSSLTSRITTDLREMVIPIDDHMVHRGDGVFETVKYVGGAIYNLEAHLQRLFASAERIRLTPRWTPEKIEELVCDTGRTSSRDDGLIRILLSRGPGSMGVNPYDCPDPQLYILAYRLPSPFMANHPQGGSAGRSQTPIKAGFMAQVKSCNYLLNALMRMEASDADLDFIFAFDEDNHLAEGPTESVGIISRNRELLVPRPDRILPGTTLDRVLELAQQTIAEGHLSTVRRCHVSEADLEKSDEILIFGTTTNVTAVTTYQGQRIGYGQPGSAYKHLSQLLEEDIAYNEEIRTSLTS